MVAGTDECGLNGMVFLCLRLVFLVAVFLFSGQDQVVVGEN